MSQFAGAVAVQMCSDSKYCLLIKCESQERHNVSGQHSKDWWARKIVKRGQGFLQNVEVKNVCLLDTQIVKMDPQLSSVTLCRRRTSKVRLNSKANSFVFGRKRCDNAPRSFYEPCKVKTSEMRLNFAGNRFIFGRINRENAPITFSVKIARRELLKCAWTQQQTASFLDAKIVIMRPEPCA